jgi:hypothetical protein
VKVKTGLVLMVSGVLNYKGCVGPDFNPLTACRSFFGVWAGDQAGNAVPGTQTYPSGSIR